CGIWVWAPAASAPTETAAPSRCPDRKRAGFGGVAALAEARFHSSAGVPPFPPPQPPPSRPPGSCPRSCPAPDAQARTAAAARNAGSAVHPLDSNADSKNIPYRVTTCVVARTVFPVLRLRLAPSTHVLPVSSLVRTIIGIFCHDLCSRCAI